jgi:hypothetical protein
MSIIVIVISVYHRDTPIDQNLVFFQSCTTSAECQTNLTRHIVR